jgi:hypothetical protein
MKTRIKLALFSLLGATMAVSAFPTSPSSASPHGPATATTTQWVLTADFPVSLAGGRTRPATVSSSYQGFLSVSAPQGAPQGATGFFFDELFRSLKSTTTAGGSSPAASQAVTANESALFFGSIPASDLVATTAKHNKTIIKNHKKHTITVYSAAATFNTTGGGGSRPAVASGDLDPTASFNTTFASTGNIQKPAPCTGNGGQQQTLVWKGMLSGPNALHANSPNLSSPFFADPVSWTGKVPASLVEIIDSTGGKGCKPPVTYQCLGSTVLAYPSTFGPFSLSGGVYNSAAPVSTHFAFSASHFESLGPVVGIWQVYASTPDTRGLTGTSSTLQSATLNTDYLGLPGVVSGTSTYTASGAATSTPVQGCPNGTWNSGMSTGDLASAITVTFHGAGTFANDPSNDPQAGTHSSLTQIAQPGASGAGARTTALQRFLRTPAARYLPRTARRSLRAAGILR